MFIYAFYFIAIYVILIGQRILRYSFRRVCYRVKISCIKEYMNSSSCDETIYIFGREPQTRDIKVWTGVNPLKIYIL